MLDLDFFCYNYFLYGDVGLFRCASIWTVKVDPKKDFGQRFIKIEKVLGQANLTFTFFGDPILFYRKSGKHVKFVSPRKALIEDSRRTAYLLPLAYSKASALRNSR